MRLRDIQMIFSPGETCLACSETIRAGLHSPEIDVDPNQQDFVLQAWPGGGVKYIGARIRKYCDLLNHYNFSFPRLLQHNVACRSTQCKRLGCFNLSIGCSPERGDNLRRSKISMLGFAFGPGVRNASYPPTAMMIRAAALDPIHKARLRQFPSCSFRNSVNS